MLYKLSYGNEKVYIGIQDQLTYEINSVSQTRFKEISNSSDNLKSSYTVYFFSPSAVLFMGKFF